MDGENKVKPTRQIPMALLLSLVVAAGATAQTVKYTEHKLKNGLRVILSSDNAVPVVSVYLIYNVGARSEEKAAEDATKKKP